MRYAYDSEGYLQKIETDGTDYTFTYDNYGNLLTVKAGNYTLATNTYGPYDGALQTSTTGNGLQTAYEYDALGRVTGVKENGTLRYRVTYNGDGQVSRVEDKAVGHTTEYEYDGAGRLIRAYRADADGAPLLQAENLYDAYGRAKSSTYVMPNQTQNYTLTYRNKSSLLSTISLPDPTGTAKISYSYDAFDRISYMFLNSMNVPDIQTTFQYVDRVNGSATYTSSRIAKETLTTENASSLTYAYTYDANGNITEIKRNNSSYLLYEYDSLGQLTRESSYTTLTYDRYAYDGSGNRVSKNTYYWSGTLKSSETYGYTNSTWGDLLTNYDGTTISYDASGNPKNWKDILILDWRGNRLKNLYFDTPDAEGIFFEYNADGIRTEKTYAERAGEVPVYTDVYTVDGSKILSEQRTDEETGNVIRTIYYVYDANGQPVGMKYNGVQYWYQKNMQGDVVRILNASGAEVVSYAYDAWGKVLSVSGSLSSTVGAANPFRYRGYYYDTETGWYYLNTRYYDPNVGRFLSPDTILGANGGLMGYNLYAYCNNNPVNHIDPTGEGFLSNLWSGIKNVGKAVVKVAAVVTVGAALIAGTIGTGGGLLVAAGVGASVAAATASTVGTIAVVGTAAVAAGATAVAIGSIGENISYSTNNNHGKTKGKEFRGGSKKQRDRWFGYENNKPFQKWVERVGKRKYNSGHDIYDKMIADRLYKIWKSLGSPFPK